MDIATIRTKRVRQLIRQEFSDIDAKFAEHTKIAATQVARWFMEGKNRRNIGERLARRIEKECGLAPYWLDTETGNIVSAPASGNGHSLDARTRDRLLALFDSLKPSQQKHFLHEIEKVAADNQDTVLHFGEKLKDKRNARAKAKAAA